MNTIHEQLAAHVTASRKADRERAKKRKASRDAYKARTMDRAHLPMAPDNAVACFGYIDRKTGEWGEYR